MLYSLGADASAHLRKTAVEFKQLEPLEDLVNRLRLIGIELSKKG